MSFFFSLETIGYMQDLMRIKTYFIYTIFFMYNLFTYLMTYVFSSGYVIHYFSLNKRLKFFFRASTSDMTF